MPTAPGSPPIYPTTSDFVLMQQAQERLLEPVTATAPAVMTTTMWTSSDLLWFLQYRIYSFLREAGIVVARLGYDGVGQDHSIPAAASTEAVTLPQNMIDVLRLAFVNYDASVPPKPVTITDVPRDDFTSLDAYDNGTWESKQLNTPTGYTQSITQTLQAFLANPPLDVGGIDLTFVAFSGALTGLGAQLPLPPEFVCYPLYGMLADAYSVEGEAYNPNMAQYCEGRWEEGVMLAKCLLDAPSFADAESV